ncbi:MAG: CrcB family protein [Planctomycetaceae bacterium]|nr:CrcB family protein [Planctomycetaceae bacterium]
MVQKLFYLAIAGAAGTLARYWLSGLVQRCAAGGFPWGTMAVNVGGCLLFGLAWAALESRVMLNGQTRLIIFLGFFGAFTTFSSFAFGTSQMLDDSQWMRAAGNILLQNTLGLGAMIAGLTIGKWI